MSASDHLAGARVGATGGLVAFAVAATLAVTPGTASAAVPAVGAWESGDRLGPRLSFDVHGPARARTVQRVSFPIMCPDNPSPAGWAAASTIVRVRAGARFTAYGAGAVLRGRFTAKDRADVSVHVPGPGVCRGTWRYTVAHRGRRIAVRTGRYLSLVSGAAAVGLETSAFGRMVRIESMQGSLPSRCSDGSQRPLTLAGPEGFVLAGPINPSGRFTISAAAGTSIQIAGAFDGGSVAATVDLSTVLPDGVSCTAATQSLVGSLAFPSGNFGERAIFPGPPVIGQPG